MSNVNKNSIEAQASKIARKACGRCGTAIEENDFCPACRDFFRELSGRKVVFATVAETLVGSEWQVKRVHCTNAKDSQ